MTRQPVAARRAEQLLGRAVIATAPVAGGDIATATKLRLSDGSSALMKTLPHAPPDFFAAEARGLRWLAEAEGDDILHGGRDVEELADARRRHLLDALRQGEGGDTGGGREHGGTSGR